jgi:hypothetical protein
MDDLIVPPSFGESREDRAGSQTSCASAPETAFASSCSLSRSVRELLNVVLSDKLP